MQRPTNEGTRRRAAYSLGKIAKGNDRAISALVKLLETSTDWYTRSLAAYSLGKIAKGNDRAISELVKLLETSTDEFTRRQAAVSLGKIDPGNKRTISALVRILETSTDEFTRRQAAASLGEIAKGNDRAISALVKLLESSTDRDTRRQAAYSLGQIGTGNEIAISALVNLLETSTDADTCGQALESLSQISSFSRLSKQHPNAFNSSYNTDNNRKIKILSINFLRRLISKHGQSINAISSRVVKNSKKYDTRKEIDVLVHLLKTSKNEFIQWQSAKRLGLIAVKNKAAIIALTHVLQTSKNELLQWQCIKSLGDIGKNNKIARDALLESIENTHNEFIQWQALEELHNIGLINLNIFSKVIKILPKNHAPAITLAIAKLKKPLIPLSNLILKRINSNIIRLDRTYSIKRIFCDRLVNYIDKTQEGRDIAHRRSIMIYCQQIYQYIVIFALQNKDFNRAFFYTELFRNRYLVERIAQQDAPLPQTIPPALAQQVQTAKQTERQTLQKYTDAISNHRPETELETLGQAWENAKQTLENLYHQVAEIEPEFIAKTKVYPIHFQEVQQLLPTDTAIIEFFFTETELITLLILPGTQSPLIPETLRIKLKPNHLETLADDWVADLEDKNKSKTDTIDANIQQLSQRIDRLGQLLNFTHLNQYIPRQIKHLIILPNNYLHLFPIHALPWNESTENQQRLIDRFSVRYFPNLHIWKICQNRQRTRDSFLGIENPTADEHLIFAKAEIAGICQTGNFKKTKVLPRDKAKKLDILQSAKNYHCFHFSGHGEYNFTNPLESYLELSANHSENLTLSTIFTDLHLPNADLATLSACCTGVVDAFQPTDECLGIATGFLLAGAKAVVSSLWKVNSIATAFLLDEFYRQLEQIEQTQDKAVALQNAQNWLRTRNADELRQRANEWDLSTLESTEVFRLDRALKRLQGRPFENPYFWAAFILTGC